VSDAPVSIRISDPVRRKLDTLSKRLQRDASSLAEEAIADYILRQETRAAAIDEAVGIADEDVFVSHESMSRWLESWGDADEKAPPNVDVVKARK
jgi:predicted transcriptional regulator